jgi:hypothetical protein
MGQVTAVPEDWSLIIRKELKVTENRVLRRIFGRKRAEIIRSWRKLRNEKFHNLSPSPIFRMIKSRRMGQTGHVARMGEKRNT